MGSYGENSRTELKVQPYAKMEKASGRASGSRKAANSQPDGNTWMMVTSHERSYINLLAGCVFIEAIAFTMVAPILPAYEEEFSLSAKGVALLLGLRSTAAIAWCIPVGFILPHLTLRPSLVASFVLFAGGSFLFAFPQNWQMLAAGCIIQGIAMMTIRIGAFSFVAHMFSSPIEPGGSNSNLPDSPGSQSTACGSDHPSPGEPGQDTDIKAASAVSMPGGRLLSFVGTGGFLYCWVSVGGLVGPVGGSYLYEYVRPWVPFTVTALLDLFLALVVALIPEPEEREVSGEGGASGEGDTVDQIEGGLAKKDSLAWGGGGGSGPMAATESPAVTTKPSVLQQLWTVLGTTFGERMASGIMVIALVQSLVWGVLEVVLATFIEGPCTYGASVAGIAFGINNGVYALVALVAGPIVGLLGARHTIALGSLVVCLVTPLIAIPHVSCRLVVQYMANAVLGIAFAFVETPLFPTLCSILVPNKIRNLPLLLGTYQFWYFLGYAIGPFLTAAMLAALQSWTVTVAASGLMFVGLGYWIWASQPK